MKSMLRFSSKWMFFGVLFGVVAWSSVCPTDALGQAGDNAVYNSSGNCSSTSPCTASPAFIDATAVTQHADICDTIYLSILSPSSYPPNGEVIDARGLGGSTLTCTKGSPWNESGVYVNKPSVILLPAGRITTSVPWVLPANTKLIGIATSGNNSLLDTTIQAASLSSGAVVQFGDSHCPSSGCQGISVEHLSISGDFDEII
jgi:hypothetical protein